MLSEENNDWFKNWFDSPYYHILYKNRDCGEAELFINNLISYLKPSPDATFLDLACGKGRHSLFLNKKGYDVTGIDLSKNSIECAKTMENDKLHFYVHDMRKLFRTNYYDYVLNLFTSFGYFDNEKDNLATISTVSKALKPGGILVLDFFNAKKVIGSLKKEETKTVDGIEFKIHKCIFHKFIQKQIDFSDKGKAYHYQEQVQALALEDFEKYMKAGKLKTVTLFGSYMLEPFMEESSERLIIVAQKEK